MTLICKSDKAYNRISNNSGSLKRFQALEQKQQEASLPNLAVIWQYFHQRSTCHHGPGYALATTKVQVKRKANSPLNKEFIIENYKHLWQIEKAFRISKTDLRIRPTYHRLPGRIAAHIVIAFTAYKLYKELERQLYQKKSNLSAEKAIDLIKTIFKIKVKLPESKQEKDLIFAAEEAQKRLLSLFDVKLISD